MKKKKTEVEVFKIWSSTSECSCVYSILKPFSRCYAASKASTKSYYMLLIA